MKKLSLILIFLSALAGSALAAGQTHRTYLNADGWCRQPAAGGLVTQLGGFAGASRFFAFVTTPTETISILQGKSIQIPPSGTAFTTYTNVNTTVTTYTDTRLTTFTGVEIETDSLASWYTDNEDLGGYAAGTDGLYVNFVTATTGSYVWCEWQEAD